MNEARVKDTTEQDSEILHSDPKRVGMNLTKRKKGKGKKAGGKKSKGKSGGKKSKSKSKGKSGGKKSKSKSKSKGKSGGKKSKSKSKGKSGGKSKSGGKKSKSKSKGKGKGKKKSDTTSTSSDTTSDTSDSGTTSSYTTDTGSDTGSGCGTSETGSGTGDTNTSDYDTPSTGSSVTDTGSDTTVTPTTSTGGGTGTSTGTGSTGNTSTSGGSTYTDPGSSGVSGGTPGTGGTGSGGTGTMTSTSGWTTPGTSDTWSTVGGTNSSGVTPYTFTTDGGPVGSSPSSGVQGTAGGSAGSAGGYPSPDEQFEKDLDDALEEYNRAVNDANDKKRAEDGIQSAILDDLWQYYLNITHNAYLDYLSKMVQYALDRDNAWRDYLEEWATADRQYNDAMGPLNAWFNQQWVDWQNDDITDGEWNQAVQDYNQAAGDFWAIREAARVAANTKYAFTISIIVLQEIEARRIYDEFVAQAWAQYQMTYRFWVDFLKSTAQKAAAQQKTAWYKKQKAYCKAQVKRANAKNQPGTAAQYNGYATSLSNLITNSKAATTDLTNTMTPAPDNSNVGIAQGTYQASMNHAEQVYGTGPNYPYGWGFI